MTRALAVLPKQIPHGWAVALSDGPELVRFTGIGAKWRAVRYLAENDLADLSSGAP